MGVVYVLAKACTPTSTRHTILLCLTWGARAQKSSAGGECLVCADDGITCHKSLCLGLRRGYGAGFGVEFVQEAGRSVAKHHVPGAACSRHPMASDSGLGRARGLPTAIRASRHRRGCGRGRGRGRSTRWRRAYRSLGCNACGLGSGVWFQV